MDEMNDVATMQSAPSRPVLLLNEACAAARRCEAEAVCQAIDRALGELVGHKLFTVYFVSQETHEIVRMYSSRPRLHPVGRQHPVGTPSWNDLVIARGQPYIGCDANDLRWAGANPDDFAELGCASMLNVPVVVQGETVGMLSLMHEEGWYRDPHVQMAMPFAYLLAPAFAAARQWVEA
ncbi:GAF domain-containing protein [Achromobacter aloeverae]|uniref:GAF domain-containing protein n=1 Tax=Achromobacter aloeverae TaxID=1750518 RepID=A0A4Q1HNQ4_9BURK|nr:GAF domain-containing protein [Achromobacter aloeverae]RXN92437.1 GAF domain-containing protein [Achromobacter aloeverae]